MWRFIVVALLIWAIFKLGRGLFTATPKNDSPEDLVRDALTGVYFAKSEGFSITRGAETYYFSSLENRDRFLSEHR